MHNLKLNQWKYEREAYVSPPLQDKTYTEIRKYLIRSQVQADCDERSRIIRIVVTKDSQLGRANKQKLENLKLI